MGGKSLLNKIVNKAASAANKIVHVGAKIGEKIEPIVEKGVGVLAPELLPEYEAAKLGYKGVKRGYQAMEQKYKDAENKKIDVAGSNVKNTREYVRRKIDVALKDAPISQVTGGIKSRVLETANKKVLPAVLDGALPTVNAIKNKAEDLTARSYEVGQAFNKKGELRSLLALPNDRKEQNADINSTPINKPGNAQVPLPKFSGFSARKLL